ncbi:MAG: signal peptide peptidase SppA [Gammaproteobacteria bacterium]|nr:signal peptide peptidase SppA [Gammaproteobacteria bacterium]MBQ0838892.1 signal peptide peptidase SppA [Gammaproteobacteria bacterium]
MTGSKKDKKQQGFFRKIFSLINTTVKFLRSAINLVVLLFVISIIASMFGNNVKPLPDKAFLRLTPSGMLVEQLTYTDPLSQIIGQRAQHPTETLLSDLIEALESAKSDPHITGLVLELDFLAGGGISKLQTVGAAITDFKTSGKPVIATGSNYSQEQYFLASFADEIHLNPMGAIVLSGYGNYHPFFKDALDKLKINFHVFRVGQYKDAVEPFIRNDMSPASKVQASLWLNELWQAYSSGVESNRELPANTIDNYVNNMGHNLSLAAGNGAQLALQHGLVDHLSPRPAMRKRLTSMAGLNEDKDDYLHVDLQEYLFHQKLQLSESPSKDKIALLVAKGTIYDGVRPEGDIGSKSFSELLAKVRKDKDIRALVLRIDSPGGSAFASEVIRREIAQIQQSGIPVVVSMGSLAASGGYWIAAGADQIWASATTITGSIGVFGVVPTFENALATLGVYNDGIGTSPIADIYHLDRPMSPQAKQLIQLSVNNIYQQFLDLVAEGRDSTAENIHEIAGGRVWTGRKAKELGLVDELGNLDDAIAAAATLAELDDYELIDIKPSLNFQQQILKQLSQRAEKTSQNLGLSGGQKTLLPPALSDYAERLFSQTYLGEQAPGHLYLQCWQCRVD